MEANFRDAHLDMVKVHLALCYAELFRKDSTLALARQCCDGNMILCDCRRRCVWEIADNVVPVQACDAPWVPLIEV